MNEEQSLQLFERTCPHCKQKWDIKPGLNNWKNLFRWPTFDDWLTLFIITMVLLSAWAYKSDTQVCRDTVNNIEEICTKYNTIYVTPNQTVSSFYWPPTNAINLTNGE